MDDSSDGLILLVGFGVFIIIVSILLIIFFSKAKNPEFAGGEYDDYENMSDAQLLQAEEDAAAGFYDWNQSQLFSLTGDNAPGGLSSNLPINVPNLVTTMLAALVLDPGMVRAELKLIKNIAVRTGRLVTCRVTTLCAKILARGGEKLLIRLGVRAAAKALTAAMARAATSLATRAAVAASTGPAAPIVAIAEFVFGATLGLLDQFGVGGYTEIVPSAVYEGMRDEYDRAYKESALNEGYEWPMIAGPCDTLSQTEWDAKISDGYDAILDDVTHPATILFGQLYIAQKSQVGRDLTDAEISTLLLTQGLGKAIENAVMSLIAVQLGGKAVQSATGNVYCSYSSSAAVDASFHWPMTDEYENDIYSEWDEQNQVAYSRQSAMRTFSEQLGRGCTYNKQTRVPNITEEFCRSNGLDYSNNQCKYAEGQEIAEMIFGKTFIRGLTQVFDPKQYEECSDKDWCYGGLNDQGVRRNPTNECRDDVSTLSVLTDGRAGKTLFCIKQRLPFPRTPYNRVCSEGYYESSPGFCKRNCETDSNGTWQDYGGICYHPKVDLNRLIKTQSEVNIGKGTPMVGIPLRCSGGVREKIDSYCYNPCQPRSSSDIKCPSGSTDVGGYCKDAAGNTVSTGWSHRAGMPYLCVKCPEGYKQVAATCEAVSRPFDATVYTMMDKGECPPGKEAEGLLCYDPCPSKYTKVQGGLLCTPNDGIKVEIQAKKRKIPYSAPDFAGSPVGQRIQQIKEAGESGDVGRLGAGLGCLFLATSPVVNGLGLQDFANMIPDPATGEGVQQR